MKTARIKLLIFIGSMFILSGMALLMIGNATVVKAQDEKAATYAGSKECASCHRGLTQAHANSNHALALVDVSKKKTAIIGDFDQGEDIRTVQLPSEDKARPFTAKDIAFVIGSGQHVQRYLYKVGANNYMVLPAEWNVETKQWEPYKIADTWPAPAYDWEQSCAYCHTTGFDVTKGRWKDPGVQCESCHGPASEHVKIAKDIGKNPTDEELTQVRSAIYTTPDAQVCGQCHSQGVGKDDHPYPVGYTPGKNLSDFFELVPKDSADHWWVTGHASQPNMQYNEWFKSAHASSLGDMAQNFAADDKCLGCHSQDARRTAELIAAVTKGDRAGQAPAAMTVTDAKWGITCQTCHYQHTDSKEPFELVQEANSLCMSCHTNPTDTSGVHHPVKEMFDGVALVTGIDGVAGAHFTAKDGPVCVTCHMQDIPVGTTSRANHTFKPVLPGTSDGKLSSACEGCHKDLTTNDMQLLVQDTQNAVKSRLKTAKAQFESLSKPQPGTEDLKHYDQASEALKFVENDGSFGIHNYNYVDALLNTAESDLAALGAVGATPEATPAVTPEATSAPEIQNAQPVSTTETVSSGVRPVTVVVIGGVIAMLLGFAVAFFRKPGA